MRRLSIFRSIILSAVLGCTAALVFGSGIAAAEEDRLDYVALGDSFSSGPLLNPVDPKAPALCLRSMNNYPKLMAADLGVPVKDVSCGAATTAHLTTSQYWGVAPQLDAVQPDTDLITITMGGNDSGVFLDAMTKCSTAGVLAGGWGNPCERQYGDRFENTINTTTHPSLVTMLQRIRAKAPSARVAIIGYPELVPPTFDAGCKSPIARGDYPYLYSMQLTLNSAVRRAAEATGATYVDMAEISRGHDSCKPADVRWTEPFVMFNAAPAHPNLAGMNAMADQTRATLGL